MLAEENLGTSDGRKMSYELKAARRDKAMNRGSGRRKMIVSLASVLILSARIWAEGSVPSGGPTYFKDVLPILQENCQRCHRPAGNTNSGMVAPMSLTTYEETRHWVKSILREVRARRMPPWFAAPEFDGVFDLERKLTDKQIETIGQ
ncbi:hypothetical protein HYR69_12230, partial [Candidatus Sumerlaeota bacterium]|nr:hypothetical protein [Candidatus Sumerlaeota bacterium]